MSSPETTKIQGRRTKIVLVFLLLAIILGSTVTVLIYAGDWQPTIASPSADHTATGITLVAVAGETLAIGDVCYRKSDGEFWKAKGDVYFFNATGVIVQIAALLILILRPSNDESIDLKVDW